MQRSLAVFLPLAVVCACNSTDNGTIQLETDTCDNTTFSQTPVPTKLVVNAIDGTNSTQLYSGSISGTVDLGDQTETDVAVIQVIGEDSTGAELIYGQSLALEYGALAGGTLPIFVQRTNQFACLPNAPSDARQAPTLTVLGGEFLFVGGGTDPTLTQSTQLYDFAQLTPLSAPPTLPRAPMSMPVVGTVGLVIDSAGADYFDFSQNAQTADVTPPMGHSFAEIAGGQSVYEVDSSGNLAMVFVVGATRTTGQATSAVLQINPNDTSNSSYPSGNLTWLTLTAPRLGATATWVPGRGLVVTGGSATAAGVEVIGTGGCSGSTGSSCVGMALAFPPDPSTGSGATSLYNDSQHLLLAGGITPTGQDAGVRVLDLSCSMACDTMGTQVWGQGLPMPLMASTAFSFSSGSAYPGFVIGSELASGLTHAFQLSSTAAKEVPTRVPHTWAQAIQSPIDSIVLVGGAGDIESFYPTLTP